MSCDLLLTNGLIVDGTGEKEVSTHALLGIAGEHDACHSCSPSFMREC